MSAKAISCNACRYYEGATSMCLQYQTVVSRPTYVYKYCPMGEFMELSSDSSSSTADPVLPNLPPKKVGRAKPGVKKAKRKVKKKKVARSTREPGMMKITDNSSVEGQTTQ